MSDTPTTPPAHLPPTDTGADDWAAAFAEQGPAPTQAAGLGADTRDGEDWASALARQTAAATAAVTDPVFKPLAGDGIEGNSDIEMILDIPVQLSVELGRTRLTIKNILQLGQGSVVELDGLAGEPMDIFVNGYLIAQGEVVVVDEKYGIRVTDIVTPADRISRLHGRR